MLRKVAATGVDLDDVYDRALWRIKDQKGDRSRLGMEVLMWVSHAERPLRIGELSHALAVEMGATDIDIANILPQDTVLEACLGLTVVDEETSTVRLIHYSLQEYLSRPGVLPDAHRTLGQTCLTYLNYDQVKRLPANNFSDFTDMPFLEYSSLHWGRHAKIELSDYTKSLALELLGQYDSHPSSVLLFNHIHEGRHSFAPGNSVSFNDYYAPSNSVSSNDDCAPNHHPFPGLHCASYFGIDEVVAALIEMDGCDINQQDRKGFTPFMWAVRQGNQGAVALLLARDDVSPDKPNNNGITPLWWASFHGNEGVVRLLLARGDVNPNKPGGSDETPLYTASNMGR